MPAYVYGGTQRGELDPWAPKLRPEPTTSPGKKLEPCGIQRKTNRTGLTVCQDCRGAAIAFGWIDAPPTYQCTHCGGTRRGQPRDLCGTCKSNLGRSYGKKTV